MYYFQCPFSWLRSTVSIFHHSAVASTATKHLGNIIKIVINKYPECPKHV